MATLNPDYRCDKHNWQPDETDGRSGACSYCELAAKQLLDGEPMMGVDQEEPAAAPEPYPSRCVNLGGGLYVDPWKVIAYRDSTRQKTEMVEFWLDGISDPFEAVIGFDQFQRIVSQSHIGLGDPVLVADRQEDTPSVYGWRPEPGQCFTITDWWGDNGNRSDRIGNVLQAILVEWPLVWFQDLTSNPAAKAFTKGVINAENHCSIMPLSKAVIDNLLPRRDR